MLKRWLPSLGAGGVPIAGLAAFGWSASTALVVYWFENLVGSLTIALRIAIHRRLTGKRGHSRTHLGVQVATGKGAARAQREMSTLLSEFLVGSLVFTLAHGFVLGLVLGAGLLGAGPESGDLWAGVLGVAAFQLLGLAIDLVGLEDRSFAWITETVRLALGRVVLIHLAIIVGVALAAWSGGAGVFFLPFAVLKLLADLGGVRGRRPSEPPAEQPPRWLAAAMERLKPSGGFAAHWAETREREIARAREDEEPLERGGRREDPAAGARRLRPARRRR